MPEKIKLILKKLYKVGFVHIFSTSVINKLLSLVTNMIIVRVMSKTEYGYFTYAYNIVTIILIVSDIGTKLARLQYCCETEDENERRAITKFLLKVGTATNIIFAAGTFLYATFLPLSIPGAKFALQIFAPLGLFQYYYDNACNSFRISKDNKKYAYLTNINSVAYLVLSCLGAWAFGISGYVLGKYIAFLVPVAIGLIWLFANKDPAENFVLSKEKKAAMIKYGLLIILTNSVSSVLHYLGTLLVGEIIADELVLADYKAATVIPNAIAFIPTACVTMIYPYFVKHKDEPDWIIKNTRKVQLFMALPSLAISIGGIILAPWIIRIVFGAEYLSAVAVFRVMMFTFFFSATFRILYGNILAMLHLVKVNFVLGTVECVINIVADVILIKSMGSIGAAYATLFITVLSALFSGTYFAVYMRRQKKKQSLV